MKITSGRIPGAIKTVIYGPEGIGKSTFAARFPNPLFIDTEGSTVHMDVRRLPKPDSWTELLEEVKWVLGNTGELGTLVLDTTDWAEILCTEHVCARAQKSGIEDFGYGKGYTYVAEEFGRLLNLLEQLKEKGVHIVLTAHAKMRKFEQPDELGAYDRWEMKLSKQACPMVKEWADMVLFASYKTFVVNVDGQGASKGKNKVQGGARVLRCTHHPCWDAKNRFGLAEEIPFRYEEIAHIIAPAGQGAQMEIPAVQSEPGRIESTEGVPEVPPDQQPTAEPDPYEGVPHALAKLMREAGVLPKEAQYVAWQRNYFPADTPWENYPQDFIDGWFIAFWPQVLAAIMDNRGDVPF